MVHSGLFTVLNMIHSLSAQERFRRDLSIKKWPPTGYLAKHLKSKHAQRRVYSQTLLFWLTQYYHPLGNGQISASKHGASRAQILWFLTVVVLIAMHNAVIPSQAGRNTRSVPIINHIYYLGLLSQWVFKDRTSASGTVRASVQSNFEPRASTFNLRSTTHQLH